METNATAGIFQIVTEFINGTLSALIDYKMAGFLLVCLLLFIRIGFIDDKNGARDLEKKKILVGIPGQASAYICGCIFADIISRASSGNASYSADALVVFLFVLFLLVIQYLIEKNLEPKLAGKGKWKKLEVMTLIAISVLACVLFAYVEVKFR